MKLKPILKWWSYLLLTGARGRVRSHALRSKYIFYHLKSCPISFDPDKKANSTAPGSTSQCTLLLNWTFSLQVQVGQNTPGLSLRSSGMSIAWADINLSLTFHFIANPWIFSRMQNSSILFVLQLKRKLKCETVLCRFSCCGVWVFWKKALRQYCCLYLTAGQPVPEGLKCANIEYESCCYSEYNKLVQCISLQWCL